MRILTVTAWVFAALSLTIAAPASGAIYWAGQWTDAVGRADLDGTHVQTRFIPSAFASGIAVDDGHLYWGAGQTTVARAQRNGTGVQPSFIASGGTRYGVAVDRRYVYWTAPGGTTDGRIGRAKIDGSEVDPQFIVNVPGPCGVAVDAGHIYWANVNRGTIGRANLDGTGVDLDFITTAMGACGIAVDEGHIYWGNYWMGGTTIGRANLDGTAVDNAFITGARYPCGIAVGGGYLYWSNEYGPTSGPGSIGRAKLDGSQVDQRFVSFGPENPRACGVAVDALVAPTVTIEASKSELTYGEPLSFTATVQGQGGPVPTGTVRFLRNGRPADAPVELDAGGRATWWPSSHLDVGDSVSASYAGDVTYTDAQSPDADFTIVPAPTASTLTTSPNPVFRGDVVRVSLAVRNLSTAVVPFGSATFFIDGMPFAPLRLDADGRVEFDVIAEAEPGEYRIVAVYEDDTGVPPDFVGTRAALVQVVTTREPARTPTPTPTPTPSPVPPGPTPTPPKDAPNVATALRSMTAPLLRGLRRRGLAGVRTSRQRFTAPSGGTLTQRITAGRTLASGQRTFTHAGDATLTLRLTPAGRRVVTSKKRMTLRVLTTFAPDRGTPTALVERVRTPR